MERVEVLSYTYESLYFDDWQNAISDVVAGRAEIIEEHETLRIGVMDGERISSIAFPKIVRFKSGIPGAKFYAKTKVKFSRYDLYIRDLGMCQYCECKVSKDAATIDHVIPRSKGGPTTWENCVLSCERCNTKKANKLLSEISMNLVSIPIAPKQSPQFKGRRRK